MRQLQNSVKFPFVGMDSPRWFRSTIPAGPAAKPLRQVDCAVPGLSSVNGRSRPSTGRPPIALPLQDGSAKAAPLSRSMVLLREASTASNKPSELDPFFDRGLI
jgi:hypothetical protein